MKNISAFSFIFLLLRIDYIKNDDNSKQTIYYIDDLTNLKCITSNYSTTFSTITNSKTPIKSNINFSFTLNDLEKISHSGKCTILGENTLRRMNEYEDDTSGNDDEESGKETNGNDGESNIESYESEEQSSNESETNLPSIIYKYKTICSFGEEIKKNIQISIEQNMHFSIDKIPEDAQIYYNYSGDRIYNISRCAPIKNSFRQVSTFNLNESENKITFLFITNALDKI
jgi:hypothetical protein